MTTVAFPSKGRSKVDPVVVEVRSVYEPVQFFCILSKWVVVHSQLLAAPTKEVDADGSTVWVFKVQFNRNPSEWFVSVAEKFTTHRPVLTVCERDRCVDWNPDRHKIFLEPSTTPPRGAVDSAKGSVKRVRGSAKEEAVPKAKAVPKPKAKAKAKAVEKEVEVEVEVGTKEEEVAVAVAVEAAVAVEEVANENPCAKRQKQTVDDDDASEAEPEPIAT
jgi:hypothetical protein